MNRDNGIITRALQLAGQESLNDEDVEKRSARYRAICAFYLPTVLSVVAQAEWTELKVRRPLVRAGTASRSRRGYAYAVPDDCARAIELASLREYEVEGRYLYTDDGDAVLLYITNGRKSETDWRLRKEGADGKKYGDAYHAGRHYDLCVRDGHVLWLDTDDDYPEYQMPDWSPELTDCVTATLAAEIAIKITADKQLYSMLMQMAAGAVDAAGRLSRTKGASRTNATAFWGDALGIPSYEGRV